MLHRSLAALLCVIGLGALPLAAPRAAEAATVRLDFSGFVGFVDGDTGGDVVLGTPFTATVIYDDATPSNPPQAVMAGFASFNQVSAPPAAMSATIGPWSVGVGPFDPDVPGNGSGFQFDLYDRTASPGSSDDGVMWSTVVTTVDGLDAPVIPGGSAISIELGGPAGTLGSFDFADIPLDLASWPDSGMSLTLQLDPDSHEGEIALFASITSLTVTTIPEPGTAALVALGLLALPVPRRRARR